MSQNTQSQTTTLVRATVSDASRMDKLAPKLQKKRGGSWSRASVINEALDALEEKLSKPADTVAA